MTGGAGSTPTQKMRIKCKKHGWFNQIPYDHLYTEGCRECFKINHSIILKKPFEEFLKKAHQKHLHRFEYDKNSWHGAKAKMRIKCLTHGWFEQIPHDHLRLNGCQKCSFENFKSRPWGEVLKSFQKKHGDRYKYDKTTYKNMSTPMIITCYTHGTFSQTPLDHIKYTGCTKCSGRYRWNTKEFIERAQIVHKNKYTYEMATYKGSLDPILVTCPNHGDFTTQPTRHILRKGGCPKCYGRHQKTTEEFIDLAKQRFGETYDYSQTIYTKSNQAVIIVCKQHGAFKQRASEHLQASIGCPQCSYNISAKETSWLDHLKLGSHVKRSANINVLGRMRSVDAYDNETNTVYEFWGDWWHGNPRSFDKNDIHPKCGVTYGELYRETLKKKRDIKKSGYILVDIWEDEYDSLVKRGTITDTPKKASALPSDENLILIDDSTWQQIEQYMFTLKDSEEKRDRKERFEACVWKHVYNTPWKAIQDIISSDHRTVSRWFAKNYQKPKLKEIVDKLVLHYRSSLNNQSDD